MTISPATMARLYPIHSISFPEGMEKMKYPEKNANCTIMTFA